jgi:photosystem II stability/assembly factor-like uncharacterized protein
MKIYNLSFLRSIPIISGLLFQLLSCNRAPEFSKASQLPDSWQNQKRDNTGTANSVFKSTDGGQTWQDISKRLPENLRIEIVSGEGEIASLQMIKGCF